MLRPTKSKKERIEHAYRRALHADQAWSDELRRTFGARAGNVRYTKRGEGEPGSRLRRLYKAKVRADKAWAKISRMK